MAESFPGSPDSGADSFPQTYASPEDAPAQANDSLIFGRYRVIRELGRGGMGVVLLAHDTVLGIDVAVKMVPDLVVKDTEAINDLRKEVLRGMALTHPGVVRTNQFEKDSSGAGIVMEYVEGNDLGELKTRQSGGCFDAEQILPWLEQLCGVLDYAHREAHIVHRDLKPRNIMVTRAGKIKVADFGIAAVVNDSMSRHSLDGKVSGTLSYMSPQQAQGMRPTAFDDIHALGATIYELLTGKPPFFRGNPLMIQTQVLTVVPPSMTERRNELEAFGKMPIPPQWEAIVAACLSKDPAARPQTALEVLAGLKREPVLFEEPTTPAFRSPSHLPPGIPPKTVPSSSSGASVDAELISQRSNPQSQRFPWLAWSVGAFAVVAVLAVAGFALKFWNHIPGSERTSADQPVDAVAKTIVPEVETSTAPTQPPAAPASTPAPSPAEIALFDSPAVMSAIKEIAPDWVQITELKGDTAGYQIYIDGSAFDNTDARMAADRFREAVVARLAKRYPSVEAVFRQLDEKRDPRPWREGVDFSIWLTARRLKMEPVPTEALADRVPVSTPSPASALVPSREQAQGQDEESFRVTSILSGNPSLAVINGRAYSVGQTLRLPNGSTQEQIRVSQIGENYVVLDAGGKTLKIPLKR